MTIELLSCDRSADTNRGVSVAAILSADRVSVATDLEGPVHNKREALERLSGLLAREAGAASREEILQVLLERERLQ